MKRGLFIWMIGWLLIWSDALGQFTEHIVVSQASSNLRARIVKTFDKENDGDLDIVALFSNGEIVWYENEGDNTFGGPQIIENELENGRELSVVDLDGNGFEDLLVAHSETYRLVWYPIDEEGEFKPKRFMSNSIYRYPSMGTADLDGDGDIDIVANSKSGGQIIWYKNRGDGEIDIQPTISEDFRFAYPISLKDMDGDGDMDIISKTNDTSISFKWFANDGLANFSEQSTPIHTNIYEILYADMDLDGDIDILYSTNGNANIFLLENNGDGNSWQPRINLYETFHSVELLEVTDVNGDGLPDIVYKQEEEVRALIQKQKNSFKDILTISSLPFKYIHSVDIDGDGDMDFLASGATDLSYNRMVRLYENGLGSDNKIVFGQAYFDVNANGVRDALEPPLNNHSVYIEPEQGMTFPDTGGYFSFNVPVGYYALYSNPLDEWMATTPLLHEVNLLENAPSGSYDFGFIPLRPKTEVVPFVVSDPTRCNNQVTFWLTYHNTGTTISSGSVSLEADDLMTFVHSTPPPTVIDGGKWTWNFSDLYPSQEGKIQINFEMPNQDFIGEILETQATVQLFNDNQELVYSKTTQYNSEVLCSYDPNDKLARSNLLGQSEFAYLADTILYTVRFQNTGNDTAFNIRIEDVLDKKLDWTTFHPITASHDYRTELNRETGLATFYFDNIMLPDSTTDKEGSNGFVMFGIASLPDLQDKIEVDNTASIFFDFNPPIITNTATLTLIEQVETDIEVLENGASIHIYPNPFSDYTTIEVSGLSAKDDYRLEVMDILGRKVRELKIEGGKVRLERMDLESGLYLVRVLENLSRDFGKKNGRILGSKKILIE